MRLHLLVFSSVIAALLVFAFVGVGCSHTTDTPASSDASSDTSAADAGTDAAPADAGPDVEQDPNVYPAMHASIPQVDNRGGAILRSVQLVTATFNFVDGGADPEAPTFNAFGDYLPSSDWWHQTLGGYGVGDGKGGVHIALPDTVSHTAITDDQIKMFIQQEVTNGSFPAPTTNTLLALYYPASTIITLDSAASCSDFGAYHGSAPVLLEGGSVETAYAVMPRCDYGQGAAQMLKDTLTAASHEFAEAATDPHPRVDGAYYLTSNDAWVLEGDRVGGEVGDLCAFFGSLPYDSSGYTVQRIWSNQAAAASKDPCQPTDDLTPARVYYGAAVRTQKIMNAMGDTADGYLVVKRGTTQEFAVNVFSQAPLAHDLSFYVGVPKPRFSDPSDLGPLKPGNLATLSLTSGHNGNGAVLKVSVAADAAPGDNFFVVRSVLNSGDFHDWPVILHVP